MASVFAKLIAGGLAVVKRAAGEPGEWRRGSLRWAVTLIPGNTQARTLTAENAEVQLKLTDFLVEAAGMQLDGKPTLPLAGDVVARTEGDVVAVYEVQEHGGKETYRKVDPSGTWYRVHVQHLYNEQP